MLILVLQMVTALHNDAEIAQVICVSEGIMNAYQTKIMKSFEARSNIGR